VLQGRTFTGCGCGLAASNSAGLAPHACLAPHAWRRAADAEKRQLLEIIEGLRRDVAALQRDVAGRDEAIAEKEKRILDLKHKTQVG